MRYKINAGLFVLFVLFISVCISNLANFLGTDRQIAQRLLETSENNLEWKDRRKKLEIGNGTDHLMWFVQISDIHISIWRDKKRQSDLRDFTGETLDVIKPPVVVASGDLTDAWSTNYLGSQQFKREWEIYKSILEENQVGKKTIWMDIRGNHDTFNVPSLDSDLNFFTKYSIQGDKHKRSYMKQITVGKDKYSFIAIDACQNPGTKRAFNFVGILDVNQTNAIIDLAEASRKSGADYIVWFGHYPTSSILSPGTGNRGIRGVLGHYDEGYVYLSGHLHTLGGLAKNMYALQDTNFFELELADWKDNRMFRVAAFDHGLFSFIDIKHKDWPIILVTNPKDSMLNIEKKEDPSLQVKSTHIRILLFDPEEIISCKVQIDDEQFKDCHNITKNLYVREWQPDRYKKGQHRINVVVTTADGRRKSISQQFALDNTNRGFPTIAKMILKTNLTHIFQAMFGFALAACILPICILRTWHELAYARKVKKPNLHRSYFRRMIRKLWILSTVDRILYPYLFSILYVLIGPWSIGHIIDGHMGIIFSWGMFVKGHFLPGTLSYLYGYFQLMFCSFPLVFIYAQVVWDRYNILLVPEKQRPKTIWSRTFEYLPFCTVLLTEIVLAGFFWSIYGPLSAFLGPLRTWSMVLHCALFYWAKTLPKYTLKSAMTVLE